MCNFVFIDSRKDIDVFEEAFVFFSLFTRLRLVNVLKVLGYKDNLMIFNINLLIDKYIAASLTILLNVSLSNEKQTLSTLALILAALGALYNKASSPNASPG